MKTYTQAVKAIELAMRKAKPLTQKKRYNEYLRQLPNYVLDTINNTASKDQTAVSLTTYAAMRAGALIQSGAEVFDPDNKALGEAASRVYRDSLVESCRRQGWLTIFKPHWNLYEPGRGQVRLSHKGRDATDEEKIVMDNICRNCEVI